jgi:amidase
MTPPDAARDLFSSSALEQARRVRAGEISSEELTRAYLDRIERWNETLNAFVDVQAERAIADAGAKDRLRSRSAPGELPPFFGVPIGIKDLNLVRGTRTRLGSRAFRYFWSPRDDRTAAQLRRGGFVFVGKLATSELGAMPVTEPDTHPPTRNPWDPRVTPGGSSGGSGSAVAAGMLPLAHGSDGAGSIRIPSSFCHLFGIKPSRGRVPDPYGRPDRHTLATCGPLARTVDDAAAMLDVLSGVSVGNPHWAAPPERPFLELGRRPPRGLRIRLTTESPITTTDPEVKAAVLRVARLLEDLGHHVDEGPPPEGELAEFLPIWQLMVSRAPVLRSSLLQPVTRWLREAGAILKAKDVLVRQLALSDRVARWFGDIDLALTPTVAVAPPTIAAWRDLPPESAFGEAAALGAFTAVFNISGQPAASVPAGVSSKGHPIGVQLAGRPLQDGVVLAVCRQLEEAMPWAERRPPLFRA